MLIGTRLGSYEVLAKLGEGGMGEVYRATDSQLKRAVAIKVLPASMVGGADRLARFQREAEVLAALNHPNIAAIYGLEKTTDFTALVMELVDGEDLSQRIARGPIPLDEALPIAKQIAEALEAAHEQGIIHRDLKPANIKVRPDGTVKVLDFGLAKAIEPASASSPNVANSPTISAHATQAGIILGTAAYMSPEQAAGRPVDKRSDLWSFGVVLLEMLTGRRPFGGESVSHVIASVLKDVPDWTTLPANTPTPIRKLLRRCLEKDRKQRLDSAAYARLEIQDALTTTDVSVDQAQASMVPRPLWRRALPLVAGMLAASALTAGAAWLIRPAAPLQLVTRFSIALGEGQEFTNTGRSVVAISPDGTQVVYVANQRLYLRSMADANARPLPGTETFSGVTSPVFSPDGLSIVFWAQSDSTLKKIAVTGGAPVTICEAGNPFGMSWVGDEILFGQAQRNARGIVRVAANGGKPELVVPVKDDELAYGPQPLPDGQAVLFTIAKTKRSAAAPLTAWDQGRIEVQRLKSGERTTLVEGGADVRYLASGHLMYALGSVLFAVPFDVGRLTVTGGPVSIVEGVLRATGDSTGAAHFSVSNSGSLVYVPGPTTVDNAQKRTLVWVDRQGHEEPIKAPARAYTIARLSPDGTRVALQVADQDMDVWIWDLAREALTRLTTDPSRDANPEWTPDGRRVVFMSPRDGAVENLYAQPADGSGQAERLTMSPNRNLGHTFSPDGTQMIFNEQDSRGHHDLMLLRLDGSPESGASTPRPAEPLLRSSFNSRQPELSPDGHWLAYTSNESGADEIYVRPFPNVTGGRWQISTNGGTRAVWARSGRELFYATSGALMAVAVQTTPTFSAGRPVKLFDLPDGGRELSGNPSRSYDVSADGKRFLMIKDMSSGENTTAVAPATVVVTLNWFEELKSRVPVK